MGCYDIYRYTNYTMMNIINKIIDIATLSLNGYEVWFLCMTTDTHYKDIA